MMRNLFSIVFIVLFFSTAIFGQHRDVGQMLFKPGVRAIHTRVHDKLAHKIDSIDVECAEDSIDILRVEDSILFDDPETDCDDYLQIAAQLMRQGDYQSALNNLGKASRGGDHEAQYRIGLMYRDGVGLTANQQEAAYWFRKAGSNGHSAAQYEIACCFEEGRGVLSDKRVAAEWFWRAAEQGNLQACYKVAQMYRDGIGMKTDLRKAAEYMRKAADGCVPHAAEQLEDIEKMLPLTKNRM